MNEMIHTDDSDQTSIDPAIMQESAHEAAELLKLLGNETRLMVLCHLNQSEQPVGELESVVGLSQSALSQHLAKLRKQRVVKTRREGQQIFYDIDDWRIRAIIEVLYELYCER